ncbi:hypothetical protein PG994_012721 [Apiospora phragmitis]|uniref:Uncharacterized protein n=1 Tax=Apiospora phragmitis TaxID=2905665 RepID=A0ABR1TBA3_9PEZI
MVVDEMIWKIDFSLMIEYYAFSYLDIAAAVLVVMIVAADASEAGSLGSCLCLRPCRLVVEAELEVRADARMASWTVSLRILARQRGDLDLLLHLDQSCRMETDAATSIGGVNAGEVAECRDDDTRRGTRAGRNAWLFRPQS